MNLQSQMKRDLTAAIKAKDEKKKEAIEHFKDIIMSELNVKKIEFAKKLEELVLYDIKPNLEMAGKKYGSLIPKIKDALKSQNSIRTALKVKSGKNIVLEIDGKQIELLPGEILIDVKNKEGLGVESDGQLTVGLSTAVSPDLLEEGFCRELVHQIQNLRKEAGFEIENTINTALGPGIEESILKRFKNYIMKETLSKSLSLKFEKDMFVKEVRVNDKRIKIGIKVVGSIMQ